MPTTVRAHVRRGRPVNGYARRAPRLTRHDLFYIHETLMSPSDYDPDARKI